MTLDVDLHLGRVLRRRRRMLEMTQQQLADAAGVTFQQIQKYEGGVNKMSAARLFALAKAVSLPIAEFFAGLEVEGA